MSEYRVGEIVKTEHGEGKIICLEEHITESGYVKAESRFGVVLKNNPFSFSPVFYWVKELDKHES